MWIIDSTGENTMENEYDYIDQALMESYEALTELPQDEQFMHEAYEAYADAWHAQYDYSDEYYW
jgi:hypothetical protein